MNLSNEQGEALALVNTIRGMPELQQFVDAKRAKDLARVEVLKTQLAAMLAAADAVQAEGAPAIAAAEARAADLLKQAHAASAAANDLRAQTSARRVAILADKPSVQNRLRILQAELAPRVKVSEESAIVAANTPKAKFPPMIDDRFKVEMRSEPFVMPRLR